MSTKFKNGIDVSSQRITSVLDPSSAQDAATKNYADTALALKAPLANPALTGTPTVPTAAVDTNTTQAASTAFVIAQAGSATPLIDGTATVGSSTRFARADHVHPTDTTRAALGAANTFTTGPNEFDTGAAGTKGVIVKAAASQTANLLEVQNSSGTALASVDSSGRLIAGAGAQPTLNARTVAAFSQTSGSSGTAIEINAPSGASNTANIFFGPSGGTVVGSISVDINTANGMLFSYYGNILRLARPASGGATFYTAVSMPYTAVSTATTLDGTHYTLDCTSGTFTVTLPAASATLGQAGFTGRIYNIKNSGTGTITVATSSSQTIDGASTQVLTVRYQNLTVQSNGANWIII